MNHSGEWRPASEFQRESRADRDQTFLIETVEGNGEASKDSKTGIWTVALPWTDFRFHGTKQEVEKEIQLKIAAYDNAETPSTGEH